LDELLASGHIAIDMLLYMAATFFLFICALYGQECGVRGGVLWSLGFWPKVLELPSFVNLEYLARCKYMYDPRVWQAEVLVLR